MSYQGPVVEVLDDILGELIKRRSQVLAGITYIVLAAGGLYLFSSIGEDSNEWYDSVKRTTLAEVGIGLLASGVLLGLVTLVVDRHDRSEVRSAERRRLRSRSPVVAAMAAGGVLMAIGLVALDSWS